MTKRIIYTNAKGGVSIVVPAGTVESAIKDVPDGMPFEIVDTSRIPTDRTFRNAWRKNGKAVQTDMPLARELAHGMRRSMRDVEMKPHDDIIAKQVPSSNADGAEAARVQLRVKYATMQAEIDDSASEIDLLAAMNKME